MAEDTLVNFDIDKGLKLVAALDQAGYDLVAAFWFYESQAERWRLKIAPRRPVSGQNLQEEFIKIVRILNKERIDLDISMIEVVDKDDPLLKGLGRLIRAEGTNTIRARSNWVNGIYVEDAVIYRLAA
jgi:hypothetical protein